MSTGYMDKMALTQLGFSHDNYEVLAITQHPDLCLLVCKVFLIAGFCAYAVLLCGALCEQPL